MRRLAIALVMTSVVSGVGLAAWHAQAMVGASAAQLGVAAKSTRPVTHASCDSKEDDCPSGYTLKGNLCVPC